MKSLLNVSLLIVLCLGTADVAAAQIPCTLGNFPPSPGSTVALGPSMYYFLVNYPDVAAAVTNGLAAWNGTHAQGRILGWNGNVTLSDCPANGVRQIGALGFIANSWCPVLRTGYFGDALAILDGFWSFASGPCPYPSGSCATGSILMNTDYYWSTTPQPGQYDIQSVIVHEFGHMFGLDHANGNVCVWAGAQPSGWCAIDPNRNSMGIPVYDGNNTCMRDINFWDALSVNLLLPP